jgi:hypothetical protein
MKGKRRLVVMLALLAGILVLGGVALVLQARQEEPSTRPYVRFSLVRQSSRPAG